MTAVIVLLIYAVAGTFMSVSVNRFHMTVLWAVEEFMFIFFFSSRRRHTRCSRDWSSDVCSSDLGANRLPEKGPLVKYWYHVNGTAPATCAHHWKESVDGSSAPDKSRPVPTTAR